MVMQEWLAKCPLIAILRGITPSEVVSILEELYASGIYIAEIPLNSPDPLEGIGKAAEAFGDRMLIGAGTVMHPSQVAEIYAVGGRLIVTPHADPDIVREAKRLGMFALPGVGTATEAFSMLHAGADGLKIFPADVTGPRLVTALRAVLPKQTIIVPVGGVDESSIPLWKKTGVEGYGIGSALYKAGRSPAEVRIAATQLIASL